MSAFIFFTGGVVSSLGKGIAAASLGRLLKARGVSVSIQKLDPYINTDAGTMNPYQHGEVFVTEDGAETDLDLGHYERFIDENLTKLHNVTTGQIYGSVIEQERRGAYLGGTVQVIPHITNEIKDRIKQVALASAADVCIIEVGGTVGDIESLPFLEAIRQFKHDVGDDHVMYIHLTLVPHLGAPDELKTKPTQHSVRELRAIGISPDAIICRAEYPLTQDIKEKIALFCDVKRSAVVQSRDAQSIYQVPLNLEAEGLAELVCEKFNFTDRPLDLEDWRSMVRRIARPKETVRVALVGKYVELKDAYISINEALYHAGVAQNTAVEIVRIDSEALEERGIETLADVSGILVAPGFGARGIKASSPRSAMRARTTCRSWAFAMACSWPVSSSRAMCAGSRTPIPGKSSPKRRTRSSISWRTSAISRSWGAPCAWEPIRAALSPGRSPSAAIASARSPNATAIASSSTMTTKRRSSERG